MSTLCAGCGHDSITAAIIEACFELDLPAHRIAKVSGIGCSSKAPTYFLGRSHGFNSVHGRMPSVTTGAAMANRDLTYIGVSGDGDTASIGLGQFCHAVRRQLNMTYIVMNNGCYGLTKGQFSATNDKGSAAQNLRLHQAPRRAERLVHGREHEVGEELRVVRVDRARVDRDRDDLARAVRLHGHHAAAGRGLDDLARRLLLRLRELGLHALGFLEHLVHVELHSVGSSTSSASKVSLSSEITSSSDSGSSSRVVDVVLGLAGLEHDGELAPGDLVERVAQQADVLRLGDLAAVEVGARGELERERVAREVGRRRLGEEARDRDRALAHGLDDAPLPRVRDLLELDLGASGARRRSDGGGAASARRL